MLHPFLSAGLMCQQGNELGSQRLVIVISPFGSWRSFCFLSISLLGLLNEIPAIQKKKICFHFFVIYARITRNHRVKVACKALKLFSFHSCGSIEKRTVGLYSTFCVWVLLVGHLASVGW